MVTCCYSKSLVACCCCLVMMATALRPPPLFWRAVSSNVLALSFALPAAANVPGEKLFEANCAVCHAGGGNVIVRSKSLDRIDLEREGYDREAIETIIARGRGAMPGFGSSGSETRRASLEESEITEITDYVEAQADAGWPL